MKSDAGLTDQEIEHRYSPRLFYLSMWQEDLVDLKAVNESSIKLNLL